MPRSMPPASRRGRAAANREPLGRAPSRMRSPAVVLLPGDGVGPEVAREARLVLELVAPDVEIAERLIGAAAIRAAGDPLPEDTLSACREANAVLKGPVGDPDFDAADVRPEQGLLRLRSALDAYANLRPATWGSGDLPVGRGLWGGRGPRACPTPARGSWSRSTARRPTSPAGGSPTRPQCCVRPRCCSSTGSAAWPRPRRSSAPSSRRWPRRPPRIWAGRPA